MLEVLDPIPNGNYNFRSAIYVEGGTVIEEKSALSAVTDGEIKDGEALDVTIVSQDENFNGIAVGGKGPYTVSVRTSPSRATAATTSSATARRSCPGTTRC